jgi:hypothetical protein
MNPRRFATVAAALCGTVVLAGWVVAWLAGFGSAGIENAAHHLLPPTPSSRTRRRQPQWAAPLSARPLWRRPPNR